MIRKKANLVIGLTTFNNEMLRISVPALGKFAQKFTLVIHNDNPVTTVSRRQIRRMGYCGDLHIINSTQNVGLMRSRMAIVQEIRNIGINPDWFVFCDDDDILVNIDMPDVSNENFAVIQNAIAIRHRMGDMLRAMDSPTDIDPDGENIICDKVLCAAGRRPVLTQIDGVDLKINVDCTTNVNNLYVTGDAAGGKMLAHAASSQARALFNNLYKGMEYIVSDIPSVIYTTPEIASIGIREQDIDNPHEYKIVKLPISYLAKSWCDGEIDGFIKLIIKDKHIKGAHIVSKEASALIMQIAIAMKADMDTDELCDVVFAHPTYSEGIMEALNNA